MGTKKGAGQTAPTMEKPKPTEQAKNASIQADTDAHALPEITVRIDKLFCDEDKKLKAFASANIGPFAVHGIRVFENDKGMFINMPSNSYTDAQGNKVRHPNSISTTTGWYARPMRSSDFQAIRSPNTPIRTATA